MAVVASGEMAVTPDLKGFETSMTNSLGNVAKKAALAVGGAFAATKVVSFFSDAVGGASDLAETVSKANTIFGSAAGGIEKWAGSAATSIGQSKQQALDAAATFGNMFSQLGIGAGPTAKMSTAMVELASDFASFHNADISEVLMAQTAAFRGEYDAVQRFVPTINAAAVEQRALADTGKKTTKELTLQEKALATQALLMEGAGKATGDFGRTSEGLANKQRILSAQMDNLKAKVGNALLPVITTITAFVSDNAGPAFEALGDTFEKMRPSLTKVVDAARELYEDQIKPLAAFLLTTVVPAIVEVGEKLVAFGGFLLDNIDTIKKVVAIIAVVLIPHLVALGAAATVSAAKQVAAWITTHVQAIASVVIHSAQIVLLIAKYVAAGAAAVVSAAIQVGAWVATAVAATANAIIIAAAWLIALGPIGLLVAAVVAAAVLIIRNWDTIKNAATAVWQFVSDKFTALVNFIKGLPGKISSAASGLFDGIKNAFKSAINWIIDKWNGLSFTLPSVTVFGQKIGGATLSTPNIPRLHDGGIFQAPFGQTEGLALLKSGERVIKAGGSGGTVFNVVVNFAGQVSEAQAYTVGQAVGRGAAYEMERAEARRAARVA